MIKKQKRTKTCSTFRSFSRVEVNTIRFIDIYDFGKCFNRGVSICAESVERAAIAIDLLVMHTIERPWRCNINPGNVSTLVLKNTRINPSAAYVILYVRESVCILQDVFLS